MRLRNPFTKIKPIATADQLGPIPTNVRVDALPEREWKITARMFAIAFFVSGTLNVSLAWAFITILPLKEVLPVLVTTTDKSEQIVRMQPFTRTMAGMTAMTEKLVREYVVMRHTMVLDDAEMTRRWGADGDIWRYSTTDEYERFMLQTRPTWEALKQRQVSRSVEIVSSSQISPGYWQVEFTVTERENNALTSRNNYVASLRALYEPTTVRYDERLLNPLGFHVANYTIAARQLSNQPGSTSSP